MAVQNLRYDHPAYITRQFIPVPLVATAASTTVAKFPAFTTMKIKSIGILVTIAGTATAASYDILNGTSSVGNINLSTNAALYTTQLTTDITLSSGGYLDIKTAAASATMAAIATVEFHLSPFGNVSA